MRPQTILACLVAALLLPGFARADTTQPSAECKQAAKSVYALSGWRHNPDTSEIAGCGEVKKFIKKRKSLFYLYRHYRQIAHYPGFRGEGIWLRWLVIPSWVVAAETRGYHGSGRWHARNPSGACGPYQLLGHTSCDVSSARDKVRHHEVAASLPRGSWAVGY